MNLDDARIVLRPRTLSESLDLALEWCVQVGRGTYLRLFTLVLVPAAVGCWLLHALAEWAWGPVWAVALLLATLLQAPFTVAAGTMMFERDVTAWAVLARCLRRAHVILVVWIAGWLWIGLGSLLAFVGVVWTWPQVTFAREVALLEGMGPSAALGRARKFVAGQHGDTLALLLAQTVAALVFIVFAEQIDMMVLGFLLQVGRPFGALFEDGGSLFALLGLFTAMPYLATVRFLRYADARTRRDGWDLQVAFLALVVEDDTAKPGAAA